MNNMNRRSFMKGLAGVVAGVSVLKAAEPKYEVSCDPGAKEGSKSTTGCISGQVIFHNRKVFSSGGKRICWTKYGEIQSWQVEGYIDLPPYDVFNYFVLYEDRLFWYGYDEIYEIQHIGGIRTFVCSFSGYTHKSAGIDPNSDWAKTQIIALEDIPKGQYGWVSIGLDKCGNFRAKPIYDKDFYKHG